MGVLQAVTDLITVTAQEVEARERVVSSRPSRLLHRSDTGTAPCAYLALLVFITCRADVMFWI